MRKTGIWLDKRAAYIISLDEEGNSEVTIVNSEIEDYNVRGGSGTRFKGGPQDVVQDSKYLEREKHQFRDYFKSIVVHLKDADVLAIFGPAEAGLKLSKELEQSYPNLFKRLKETQKADSMTQNQMVALVKRYYGFLN